MTDDSLKPSNPQGPPLRRKPKSLTDLAALLGSAEEKAESSHSEQDLLALSPQAPKEQNEVQPASQSLILPQGLEKYLSPDLWRKINGVEVRHGVLINALDQLRSVLYLISTYLPAHLVQEKMEHPVPGIVKGGLISGSLLFSDVSGFTALSEKLEALGPKGAERMTILMNQYFTTMLEILSWSGGILIKFAGDAMLAYFPAQENGSESEWAVRAGIRMIRAMPAFADIETPSGKVSLKMKIGIATGEFLAASVGDAERMEYVIIGEPVIRTMNAEGNAIAGQLVADRATKEQLGQAFSTEEIKKEYFLINYLEEHLDDFELRAERRRARGSIPWSANPQTLLAQMEIALKQIEALKPFLAYELIERIIVNVRQRRFESEFRPTTVMFCNFTGLEPLLQILEREAPQRVTGLLNAYFVAMNQIITRYGGMVSRIDPYKNGSKMLVLFGAPVTHEDDPQRAASAALAMHAELTALNERWSQRLARLLPETLKNAPLLQLKIGITQGTTFAGLVGSSSRREYTVMGDEVNLAARLMGAAEAGQVLISQAIFHDISDYFLATALAPIKVKGKTKPIPIFQVEAPRQDTLLNRIRSRPALIAREHEVADSLEILDKAFQEHAQILLITGAAGIGKSHLADVIVAKALELQARALFFQSRSYLYETQYAAWAALLRLICNITPLDSPTIQEQKFDQFLKDITASKQQCAQLSTVAGIKLLQPASDASEDNLQGLSSKRTRRWGSAGFWDQLEIETKSEKKASSPDSQQDEPDPNQAALLFAIQHLASQQPLLIIIEDAHYLDPVSKKIIFALNRVLGNARVLFILLQREEENPRMPYGKIIRLRPFDMTATSALMAQILVSELVPIIQTQTNGNPLLIEQITRWLQRTHKISHNDLSVVLQTSDLLQKLILSSLEALPESHREVARAASVIGYEFRSGELKAIQPHIDTSTLSQYTRDLIKNQLIISVETGIDPQYTFQQTLMRDILYNSIPHERRREYHATLAEYLATSHTNQRVQSRLANFLGSQAERSNAQLFEIVAGHYEKAEQWLNAARYNFQAAREHAQNQHLEKALEFCQRAINTLDHLSEGALEQNAIELRGEILSAIGGLFYLLKDHLQAIAAWEASLPNLSGSTQTDLRVCTTINLALLLPSQNRANEGEQLLRGTAQVSLSPNVRALAALAWMLWRGNNEAEAAKTIAETLSLESTPSFPTIHAMLIDLSGQSEAALQNYQHHALSLGTALILLKYAQQADLEGLADQTLNFLEKAEKAFSTSSLCAGGSALIHYHRAQIWWKSGNPGMSRLEILKARDALDQCSGKIQKDGRDATHKALKVIDASKTLTWPDWSLLEFQDHHYRSILFTNPF